MAGTWPTGSVTCLIGGRLLKPITTAMLCNRLKPVAEPAVPVLNASQFTVLAAVAVRLIPQNQPEAIDLAAAHHRQLADGVGDGWRFAEMPPDVEAVARGLTALDATAITTRGVGFAALIGNAQDALLRVVQIGEIGEANELEWAEVAPSRWFSELLAALADLYYSHPRAQEEIGFAGMADARGWQDTGFAARAVHEPQPLATPLDAI